MALESDSASPWKPLPLTEVLALPMVLGAGLVASGIGIAWLAGQSKTSGPNGAERPTARAFVAPTPGGFSVGFGGTLPTW